MFDYKQRPFSHSISDLEYDVAVGRVPVSISQADGFTDELATKIPGAHPSDCECDRCTNPRKPHHGGAQCNVSTCGTCKY